MPASKKGPVFEHLFYTRYDVDGTESPRYDEASGTIPLERRLVYSDEVERAHEHVLHRKTGNRANFTKDFLRKDSRNRNWPERLSTLRWTITQRTGSNVGVDRVRNFVFLPYAADQVLPFPDEFPVPPDAPRHSIQSVTISVASKQIERLDEPRLMQIVVDLRIVETHFALYSLLNTADFKVVHIDHLQVGIKMRKAEIDGLYLAEFMDSQRRPHPVLITVEAKKHDEFVNSSQVLAQVEQSTRLGVVAERIVPIALKHVDGGVAVFEFEGFVPEDGRRFREGELEEAELQRVKSIIYEVRPTMPGLSVRAPRPRTLVTRQDQLLLIESQPTDDGNDVADDEDDDDEGDD